MKLLVLLFALTLPASAAHIELVAGGGTKVKDAPAKECALLEPFGVEFTPEGKMVIVEMTKGQRVLKVDAQGMLRVIGGTGEKGYSGDGGPVSAATFNGIHNLAIAPGGDVLLSDSFNHTLRKIDAKTGVVTTLAGNGKQGFAVESGPAKDAQFSTLIHIALDAAGQRLYCADIGNKRIRRIDLASGQIETIAGNGKGGVSPDGADAKTAPLVDPRAVVPDAQGGFYILERNGNALRYVDAAGKIKTVVGTGAKGLSGDDGPGILATMNGPKHLCLDRDGTVLIADAENHVIRRYSPKDGKITRVAGTGKKGAAGLGGDPLQCELARPHGVTIGPDGTLYITDSYNDRVLRIVP
jgi:DNA-binding beta-propeller fold protein YncE